MKQETVTHREHETGDVNTFIPRGVCGPEYLSGVAALCLFDKMCGHGVSQGRLLPSPHILSPASFKGIVQQNVL